MAVWSGWRRPSESIIVNVNEMFEKEKVHHSLFVNLAFLA
jgi:hypothetical protein